MTNTQLYCDHCSERIHFPDKLTVQHSSIGELRLDLCYTCSLSLYNHFKDKADATKEKRKESSK